ncbi:MAG: nicotinate-nicotinamide nucleotide adenylyltransferase [Phycisphaerales bacterium]
MDLPFDAPGGHLPLPLSFAEPPIPGGTGTILVFGGSFDPPHVGHSLLASHARVAAGLDWLLVIPAAQSPHKDAPPLFEPEERLKLVKLAFANDSHASVSRMELDRRAKRPSEPSYTVDTLHTLRGFLPLGVQMRLLLGADQVLSLHRWLEPLAIMAMAEPLVMRRTGESEEGAELAERIAANWPASGRGLAAQDWAKRIIDVPLVDASSTEVRRWLGEPESEQREARLRELLEPAVYERVRKLRL